METDRILQHLVVEDLPADLQLIVENEGIEHIKKLLKYWDGFCLSLPKINFMESLMVRYIELRYRAEVPSVKIAREIDRPLRYVNNVIRKLEKKSIRD